MTVVDITPAQLLLCLLFVAVAGVASILYKLKLEKDLAWGTVRTFAQLLLMGYVLTYIFQINNVALILLLFVSMVFWAAFTIRSRIKEKSVSFFLPTFVSMVISYTVVAIVVTAVIVQVKPWYTPQYFIPLGGMIMGNSMNAIAVALDRMFSDMNQRRDEIELTLCLGATYQEATGDIFRGSIRAGMIPSINALMTVGLVSLPGMMTGQILSGTDPLLAVKYQIIVMLMLVASTAIGSVIVVSVVRRRCFTRNHQMIV
ncbi:MAG: iron export ABC transporter permease subunit FetB [Candidatus Latescibacteria bacterium]|nr:iron export ABC transporter permease subunit FetB [Candidatus Latescibacterota bacterium]